MSFTTRNALISLFITISLIGTVSYAVNYLNNARIAKLSEMEDQLSIDMLSLDTQFSLLEASPCEDNASPTALTSELADFGGRLSYAENQLGGDDRQVIRLKEKYSLLQIRDYLITKRFAKECGINLTTVLYFYSNKGYCDACARAGFALSYLRDTYPMLRVYSFDYDLNLGALRTLININKIQNVPLPAFIINGKRTHGFTSLADLKEQFPKGALAITIATSTKP